MAPTHRVSGVPEEFWLVFPRLCSQVKRWNLPDVYVRSSNIWIGFCAPVRVCPSLPRDCLSSLQLHFPASWLTEVDWCRHGSLLPSTDVLLTPGEFEDPSWLLWFDLVTVAGKLASVTEVGVSFLHVGQNTACDCFFWLTIACLFSWHLQWYYIAQTKQKGLCHIDDRKAIKMPAWTLLTMCKLKPPQEKATFNPDVIIQYFLAGY